MDFIREILANKEILWIQFAKYAFAGGLATGIDILVFFTLSWRLIPALKSEDTAARILPIPIKPASEEKRSFNFVVNSVIAFIFSNFAAYILNVLWVFEAGRHSRFVEVVLFYSGSTISVALGTFLGWLMIKKLHWNTTFSYTGKLIVAILFNFICRKLLIFAG